MRTIITLLWVLLLLGCELDEIADTLKDKGKDDKPTSVENAQVEAIPVPISGNARFLWKPDSESRPGAAVLLPYQIRQEDIYHKGLVINGDKGQVYEHRQGYANGNRIHIFLHRNGGEYGNNIKVELPLKNGNILTWTIPQGAARYEKVYKP